MSDQPTRFAQMAGIHPRTAACLEKLGMATAFPVQEAVIPIAIKGTDVLVQSPTGSGKTLAFGLPIIEQLDKGTDRPAALVLVPTRELAVQVCAELFSIANGKSLKVVACFGGSPISKQAQAARTAAIVVATPGRLDDLIRSRKIDVRGVQTLVLDEADRMLDMGFQPQVDGIVEKLGHSAKRQTLLFSATLEGPVAKLAATYATDPQTIRLDGIPGEGGEIEHVVWQCTMGNKVDSVLEALETERDLAVVFVRTKRGADTLTERLQTFGVRATCIHGGMTQRERLAEYRRFQNGACDVLVATDVFARGMDLDRITLVINYDLPEDADTYRHRSGRTGRAGRTGLAITLLPSKQRTALRRMFRTLDIPLSAFDEVRRTERTGRMPLPADQHFNPATARVDARPDRAAKQPYERGHQKQQRPSAKPHAKANAKRAGSLAPWKRHGQGTAPRKGNAVVGGDGHVLSYDPDKGFGFIKPNGGGQDIFFHQKAVKGTNPRMFKRGTRVSFEPQQHQRGVRAANVRALTRS